MFATLEQIPALIVCLQDQSPSSVMGLLSSLVLTVFYL